MISDEGLAEGLRLETLRLELVREWQAASRDEMRGNPDAAMVVNQKAADVRKTADYRDRWSDRHLSDALCELQAARAELALLRPVGAAAFACRDAHYGDEWRDAAKALDRATQALRASGWTAPAESEVGSRDL